MSAIGDRVAGTVKLQLVASQESPSEPGMVVQTTFAGVDGSGLSHVDLYSRFPFAVQAGAAALGLDEGRELSVTGGLR